MQKKIAYCVGALLLCLSLGWFWYGDKKPASNVAVAVTSVQLSAVEKREIPLSVDTVGYLIAPKSITLTSQLSGQVEAINFQAGQWVKQGQTLISLAAPAQAQALRQAKVAYHAASTEYMRYKKMNASSPGSIDDKTLVEKQDAMRTAKSKYQAAEAALKESDIVAPFSGYVGALQSTPSNPAAAMTTTTQIALGSYLAVGQVVTTLIDPSDITAVYSIADRYGDHLAIGQKVQVRSPAYPNKNYIGSVTYISKSLDKMSQSYRLHAKLDDSSRPLEPGMSVMLSQVLDPQRSVLVVPGLSLVPSISAYNVYQVKQGKVMQVPVKIGARYRGWVEIVSGLSEGDKIITSSVAELHPGMPVTVATS